MKKEKPKVIVFIDGANMFYSQRYLGWIFDWKKIKKLLERMFEVKEFNYYTPLKEEEQRQKKQIERLKKFGLIINLFSDGVKFLVFGLVCCRIFKSVLF